MQPILELRWESKNSLSAVEEDASVTNKQAVEHKLKEELTPGIAALEPVAGRNSPNHIRSLSLRKQVVDKTIVWKWSTKVETSLTCSTKANIPIAKCHEKKKGKIIVIDS